MFGAFLSVLELPACIRFPALLGDAAVDKFVLSNEVLGHLWLLKHNISTSPFCNGKNEMV